MQRFKSPGQAQHFLSAHAFIHGHFHPRRHLMAATANRTIRSEAFNVWRQETSVPPGAGDATWHARGLRHHSLPQWRPGRGNHGATRHRSLTTMRSYVRRAKLGASSPSGKLDL